MKIKNNGSITIIITLVMSVVILFAVSLSTYCMKQYELSLNMYDHYNSLNMAESGMEYVKSKIDYKINDINLQIENKKEQCDLNGITMSSTYASDLLNTQMFNYCTQLYMEKPHYFQNYKGSFKIYNIYYNDSLASPKTVYIDILGTYGSSNIHYKGTIKFKIENNVVKSKITSWYKE